MTSYHLVSKDGTYEVVDTYIYYLYYSSGMVPN